MIGLLLFACRPAEPGVIVNGLTGARIDGPAVEGWWLDPDDPSDRRVAWPAPAEGSGAWKLADALSPIPAQARVIEEALPDGTVVRLPDAIPDAFPAIRAGEYLVLVGDAAGVDLVPLVPAGPQTFGSADAPRSFSAWKYLGVGLENDGAKPVSAAIDGSRIVRHDGHHQKAAWIPAEAVPPGDYGVAIGRDLVLVRFEGG